MIVLSVGGKSREKPGGGFQGGDEGGMRLRNGDGGFWRWRGPVSLQLPPSTKGRRGREDEGCTRSCNRESEVAESARNRTEKSAETRKENKVGKKGSCMGELQFIPLQLSKAGSLQTSHPEPHSVW